MDFALPFPCSEIGSVDTEEGFELDVMEFQVLTPDGNIAIGLHWAPIQDPEERMCPTLIAVNSRYKTIIKQIDISSAFPHGREGEDRVIGIRILASKKSNEFWCLVCFEETWSFNLLSITASGPFERDIFAPGSVTKNVSLTQIFPSPESGESRLPINGNYISDMIMGEESVYFLTGPFQLVLHQLHLKSLEYSVVELRGRNPPDGVPWLFTTGSALFDGKIFFSGRGAEGKLSSPEFVGVVSLERKVVEFLEVHPDPEAGFPPPRVSPGYSHWNGQLLFIGGLKAQGDPMFDRPFTESLSDAWALNLRTLTWKAISGIPAEMKGPVHLVTSGSGAVLALWKDKESREVRFLKSWRAIPSLMELSMMKTEQSCPGLLEMTSAQQMTLRIPKQFRKP